MSPIYFAFLITFLAGICTTLGALIVLFYKKLSDKILSIALGFSAGAMIYVSFIEIFSKGRTNIEESFSDQTALLITTTSFFVGIIFMAIIDKAYPEFHHYSVNQQDNNSSSHNHRHSTIKRLGLFSAFAIFIHNFPEGLATFFATLDNPQTGISFAVAIAIHNIPEGLAISLPIYYSTGSKTKALLVATFSGLSEPIGAAFGYFFLSDLINEINYLMGIIFAFISGIMVFIAIDELIPASKELSKDSHRAIYSLIVGMFIMAISLILFI